MTNVKFKEMRYDWRTGKENFYRSHSVDGDTEEKCFEKIYTGYVRPSRYCSDVRYYMNDAEQEKRWLNWRKHGVTFEMFYGNATVD